MAKITGRQRRPSIKTASATTAAMQKRRRKAVSRVGFSVVLVVLFLGCLWAGIQWAISAYLAATMDRQQVSAGAFIVSVAADGMVLRDELLCVAPDGGYVTLYVYEGDTVSAGQHVASLDNAQSTQSIMSQIADLEQRLLAYDGTEIAALSELDLRIQQDEEVLRQKMTELRNAAKGYDRTTLHNLEQEIKQLNIARLERVSQRLQMPDDPYSLQDKLDALQQQLEHTGAEVFAPQDGIISFWVDGAESTYSSDSYNQVSAETILTPLIATDMSKRDEVKAGAGLFKVVDPGIWLWVGLVPTSHWEKPEDRYVHFLYNMTDESGEVLQGRLTSYLIDSRVEQNTGMQRITVQFSQMVPAALAQRQIHLEYIKRESQGLVLHKDNLLERNNQKGILVVEDGVVRFIEVTVADSDGDRVLIANMAGTYEVIMNPALRMIGLTLR